MSTPVVLLPYQRAWVASTAEVKLYEKSRRIGISWATAAECALLAASADGMDCWYVGYNREMAQEFIRDSGEWAKHYSVAAAAAEETVFVDMQADGTTREILAFVIRFASGFRITALSSRPNNLRGKQGYVIIDEAAFHDRLEELIKAAMALTIWGGRVAIISTHDGVDNPFNALVGDVRAGKFAYDLHRITLDDALDDGLYERICLRLGKPWTQAGQTEWRDKLVALYGSGADEELFCIPKNSGGAALSRALIEQQMFDAPVVRLSLPDEFVLRDKHSRRAETLAWCRTELEPLLDKLPPNLPHAFGQDFGRVSDLTVIAPVTLELGLSRRIPFMVELRNVPHDTQVQIITFLGDRLPRFIGGALDASGNGSYVAEAAALHFGFDRIQQVKMSEGWYREEMPRLQAALQDGLYWLPRDLDVLDDLRDLRTIGGLIKLPAGKRKGADGQLRHGDSAIAVAMALAASRLEVEEYDYQSVPLRWPARKNDDGQDDDDRSVKATRGFRARQGAL